MERGPVRKDLKLLLGEDTAIKEEGQFVAAVRSAIFTCEPLPPPPAFLCWQDHDRQSLFTSGRHWWPRR